MKGVRYILVLAMLFWGLPGWSEPTLNQWLCTSGASSEIKEQAYQQVEALITSIKIDPANDHKTLQRVFHKVQATFLKRYQPYADFQSLFTDGTYDCLTATTLFTHVLTEFNFEFDIIETNYHIFILVQTSRGEVMLETTDRLGGFVTDRRQIENRTGDYQKNKLLVETGDRVAYQYTCNLYQKVSPEKLSGLLLYNQAVKAFNLGDWLTCARFLEKSHTVYSTPRGAELGDLLIRTVIETNAGSEVRQECMSRLKPMVMAHAIPLTLN